MTQDEIIRMAREAGFEVVDGQLRLYFDGSKALLKPNYIGTVVDGLKEFATIIAAHEREKQAEQKPVAITVLANGLQYGVEFLDQVPLGTPLYAAPVRTKDLTDEELNAMWYGNTKDGWLGLFRAVIAADRSKNGII